MNDGVAEVYAAHDRFVWGLCYRMTGSAADADDLMQETFVRAMERPPQDQERPWRPWLARVATNLSIDRLRARKRQPYVGVWLPTPVETNEALEEEANAATRYGQLESMTLAFLVALEALDAKPRAVLLLRDVFDYSVREVGEALELSEANVKVLHHRARRTMASYDERRVQPGRKLSAQTQAALQTFLLALVQGDLATAESILRADVRSRSDGGGEFFAARKPVIGAARVASFYCKNTRRSEPEVMTRVSTVNHLPTVLLEYPRASKGAPPKLLLSVDVDSDGKICEIYCIMASSKVSAVFLDGKAGA